MVACTGDACHAQKTSVRVALANQLQSRPDERSTRAHAGVRWGGGMLRVLVEPKIAPLLLQHEPCLAPGEQQSRHFRVPRWRCSRMSFLARPCATYSTSTSTGRARHASHGFCPRRTVCDGPVKAPAPERCCAGALSQRRCRRGARAPGRRVTVFDWCDRGHESTVSDTHSNCVLADVFAF